MVSREPTLTSPVWRGREADIFPVVNFSGSDSANLDGCAEVRWDEVVAVQEWKDCGMRLWWDVS